MPLPSGTVTFLFTDIEGSTRLWEEQPDAMRMALARHDALLRQCIEDNGGVVFKTIGDAFCAAFATAPDALAAALTAQRGLNHGGHGGHGESKGEEDLPPLSSPVFPSVFPVSPVVEIKVRMALHTGAAELRDNDYFGQPLNRVARLLAAGHGGQVLLSDVAHDLARDALPSGASLKPLGEHRLRDLGRPEPVFQLLHPALLTEFLPLKSLDNPTLPNNLPQQVTSFIGREKEIEAVKALLIKTRLLTLTGSGGCGKTRLGLQVAADMLENYPEGAWLVELASLADPALVPQAMAQVLNVTEEAGKPLAQTLASALKDKKMLLVLDNCEHVLDACARLADMLLRNCPHLRVLASSREGLGIAGETIYRIPSLSLPDLKQAPTPTSLSQYEAVRLFVDRAQAAQPAFAVTNQNAPALASLCHRLDGIPLALELAAARVRSLSVEEINGKLDNRFRLLTGGSRTALPRQQTLRALIDWSYDLLSSQEKTLLRRLSVFAGGWTLAAAEQVGAGASETAASEMAEGIEDWEVLDLLTSLADKSLIVTEQEQEQTRYRLLETVRQYARDRLAEGGESLHAHTRHGDYFVMYAEEIEPKLTSSEQAQWLGALAAEHDNLRQALTWYAEDAESAGADAGAGEKGLRLAAALVWFWRVRGHFSEGWERLRAALEHPGAGERSRARAAALDGAGDLILKLGDHAEARALQEESLAIFTELGDKRDIAYSLLGLGNVAHNEGDYAEARSLWEQSLALGRELGDKSHIVHCLNNLGIVACDQGDFIGALSLFEEGLPIYRELGYKRGLADSLSCLGNVANGQGNHAGARALHEESLTLLKELEDKRGIAYCLADLGNVAYNEGDYAEARARYEESLTLQQQLGSKSGIANCLNRLGLAAYGQGNYAEARALLEESLTITRALGEKRGIANAILLLGIVAQAQGDHTQARAINQESLARHQELGDKVGIAFNVELFAVIAANEPQPERSARLWGAAAALREAIGIPLPPAERERQERAMSAVRAQLSEQVFAAAWAEGRALTMEQVIEYALEEASSE